MAPFGRKYKTVKHKPTGTEVTIYVNKEDRFKATYADKDYYGDTPKEVEEAVLKAVAETANVVWKPVMQIRLQPPKKYGSDNDDAMHTRGDAEFEAERFYITTLPDGRVFKADWNTKPENRIADAGDGNGRHSSRNIFSAEVPSYAPAKPTMYSYKDRSFLTTPYSEEAWVRLTYLQMATASLFKAFDMALAEAVQPEKHGLGKLVEIHTAVEAAMEPFLAVPELDTEEMSK